MRIARLIALLGIAAAISLTTGVRASAAAGPESTPPKCRCPAIMSAYVVRENVHLGRCHTIGL